ncbi:hypothetical protein Sm713_32590 [Streptomyces sp. TS71-3]|nr:hypothetical protein Sm713_32590 [Streptomyces sp. TS71-3]
MRERVLLLPVGRVVHVVLLLVVQVVTSLGPTVPMVPMVPMVSMVSMVRLAVGTGAGPGQLAGSGGTSGGCFAFTVEERKPRERPDGCPEGPALGPTAP